MSPRAPAPATRRSLRRDNRGAAALEFALISLPLIAMILGMVDFGYRMYLGAVVEGTVHRAARLAAVGNLTGDKVDEYINGQLKTFSHYATIEITKKSYFEYSGVGKPEKITQDTNPVGSYNVGDCFEDMNGNGIFDSVAGKAGVGGADDIVYYKVTATFPRIVPLTKIFGFSATETVSSGTALRNQPFATQIVPLEVCSK